MRRAGGEGQSAIFDAIVFLVILMVSSAALFVYAGSASSQQEASLRSGDEVFAQRALLSLMRSDVGNWSYVAADGQRVNISAGDMSVEAALMLELSVLRGGGNASFEDVNANISRMAGALVGNGRCWALYLRGNNGSSQVFLSNRAASPDELPSERSASSLACASFYGEEALSATLYLWRD